jgi:hypothetical protein
MEEAWLTQDCWFRLATTLAGICVTDCWKLVKFHVSAFHPYSTLTIKDFAEILSKTTGYRITLCRPNVGEGQYPYLWANRNGSSKKSASTSPVTLAAQKRAEASKLAASAATATRVSFTGRLSIARTVGYPYVCPALAIAATASSTTCD